MGWRTPVRVLVVSALAAGCAVLAGIEDPAEPSDTDGGVDAPARVPTDGAAEDAAGPCVPSRSEGQDGIVRATRAAGVAIDGMFDDWRCVPRIEVKRGAFSRDIAPASTFEIAAQWDEEAFYLYGSASTTEPGLDNTGNQIFKNDSLHFYMGPLPRTADGAYRSTDWELVFDHDGRKQLYQGGISKGSEIESAVTKRNVGGKLTIEVELRFPRAKLGLGETLGAGQRYWINAQLNDARGANQSFGFRTWHLSQSCACVQPCCETAGTTNLPYCDSRCSGELAVE